MDGNSIIHVNAKNTNNIRLRSMFWNIEGAYQILNMSKNDLAELVSSHIICIYETWSETPITFSALNGFSKVEVAAKRVFDKGRAKGGIAMYWRNDIFSLNKCIAQKDNFIFVRLKAKSFYIIKS